MSTCKISITQKHFIRMKNNKLMLARFSSVLIPFTALSLCGFSKQKPNIIIILADDMGYSDIGCYGGEIETPNLDQLAKEGVRFTQFYNAARCCPSRASLLTGLYPAQAGIGHMNYKVYQEKPYQGYLNENCVTLADVMKSAGYATNMAGKWHVGTEVEAWPSNRGFERFWGIHNWVDSYYKVLEGCEIYQDGKLIMEASKNRPKADFGRKDWYTTDVFTDKSIEYIDASLKENKPFFLYTAYNAPHWPLEAPDSTITKYIDRYKKGWSALIQEKTARMKKMGLIDNDLIIPDQEILNWNSLPDSIKLDAEFRRAIYAAQIDNMDYNIGRIIKHLKEKGIYENTVIIFLSDNGCCAEPETEQLGYKGGKNTRWNYADWKYNSSRDGASQGIYWCMASNTPFRMYKKYIHEGGIATPFIISYPAEMKKKGRLEKTPGFLPDIMATCIELSGAIYPTTFNGHAITPHCGSSLAPAIYNQKLSGQEFMCWEHENHGGIRQGDWKLVTLKIDNPIWELYNLKNDRSETKNLAAKYPEKVNELKALWDKWAYNTGVLPRTSRKKR